MRHSVVWTAAAVGVSLVAGAVDSVSLKIVPDRASCVYGTGETAVLTVAAEDGRGRPLRSGRLAYVVDNFGALTNDTGRVVDLSGENPFQVKVRRKSPGFNRLKIRAASGGLSLQGAVAGEYVYGVAFEPEGILPGTPDPADFDAFWSEAVRKVEETVPLDPRLELVEEESRDGWNYYRVSFATCGGRRVYGWLSEPKDASGGPYPVRVRVPGAGFGTMIGDRDARAVVLTMNVHAYAQPEELGPFGDSERRRLYDEQARAYARPNGVAAYCHAGIHLGREQYFYYASILGISRAIDWTLTRPLCDRRSVTYAGTSQGGGFGLILAGLNHNITRCYAYVPALTDLLGYKAESRQSGWPRLVEAQRPENRAAAEKWAPYFCGANFARRITCPIQFVVGFSDLSCPPNAVYGAYNVCPSKEKRIVHGVDMGHTVFSWLRREPGSWDDGYTTVAQDRHWTGADGLVHDARFEGDYVVRFDYRVEGERDWRFMEVQNFLGSDPVVLVYGKPLAAEAADFPTLRCGCLGWPDRKVEVENMRVRTYSTGRSADPLVGTDGNGHLSPAAAWPFGLVQAGPDTSTNAAAYVGDWAHTSGYRHGDEWLFRFSQTHLFGTGCASMGNVGLLPFVGSPSNGVYCARLDKRSEVAEPGYYAVQIGSPRIACEMTAKAHAAAYRFGYGEAEAAKLLLDADWGVVEPAKDADWKPFAGRVTTLCEVAFDSPTTATGRIRVADWVEYEVCFAMAFSHPVRSRRRVRQADGLRGDTWELDFGSLGGTPLSVRLALSTRSVEAAVRNLAAEMPDFDFPRYCREAAAVWGDVLSRVTVGEGADPQVAANLRSALYRLCLQPNVQSDVGERPSYSTFSLWDTYRAAHPLYTLLFPERVDGFVNSLLDQGARQGYLPIWSVWGKDSHCMVGHHAVPVIADAWLKGFRGFDGGRAFAAVTNALTVTHVAASKAMWGLLKEDWAAYDRLGYVPMDGMSGSAFDSRPVCGESVSRTLECAYDDACAARFARALGKDGSTFDRRSGHWRNVFDASVGFVRGRRADGSWRTPFNPFEIGHCWWQESDFTEGNAWQWTWHVMQDVPGLVSVLGGSEGFGRKLDALFAADSRCVSANGVANHDVTGLIGQYAHGNEPSHHAAYLFRWSDRPWRTDEVVRQICETQYAPTPAGLCGNDDCGQMAAWYAFSALGFYPVDPCGGEYVVGAPQVPRAEMKVRGSGEGEAFKTFSVLAHNLSKENKYVKSMTLNGRPVTDWRIRHADIVKGGELVFEMADRPVKETSGERDVVIYGSTPAAVTAAISARRMGRSVVIVSPERHVGGLTVSGLGFTDSGNTSTIGGLAREFYRRIYREYEKRETWRWQDRATFTASGQRTPAMCESDRTMWTFEPHVAEKVIGDWLAEFGIEVIRGEFLDRGAGGRSTNGVERSEGRIVSFRTLSGRRYRGRQFIDATYEGDLMAAAGVPYRIGRESASEYGEEWNGNQPRQFHHGHHFKKKISAYRVPGDPTSGLCPEIGSTPEGERGAGDDLLQAYCYRLCMTDCPENRLPFARPEGYDPARYELLRRVYAAGYDETFVKFDRIPNRKTDTNNHGPMNADYIGGSREWPEATYVRRAELARDHRRYQEGLYYFIANDPSVPEDVRREMSRWGLARDEFAENGGWPYHIYVREGRRLTGEYVMTERDCMRKPRHARQGTPKGAVAMGSYCLDSHNVRRYVTPDGDVQNEGDVGVDPAGPYPIDYGSIVPRKASCENLIVPVALSASHIAFGSIRMEPVFFELGQAAGTAAAQALAAGCAVQDVPYAALRERLLADGQILKEKRTTNVALRRSVIQSSAVDFNRVGHLVTDGVRGEYDGSRGSYTSVWQSKGRRDEWICVDLGAPCAIDRVVIDWYDNGFATDYELQVSDDAVTWRTVVRETAGRGGRETQSFARTRTRYLRLFCRATEGLCFAVSELEAWGEDGREPSAAPGGWRVRRATEVKADGVALSGDYDDSAWLPAVVPGTVLTSFLKAGAIPDMNVSDRQLMISDSYFNADFWYRHEFMVGPVAEGERLWLDFAAINWKADVYLNGCRMGEIDGGFLRKSFDVTEVVRPGKKNVLAVLIRCNDNAGLASVQNLALSGPNGGGLGADNPTFAASQGWDWVPTVRGRNIGIYRDVSLRRSRDVRLTDGWAVVDLDVEKRDFSRADVTVRVRATNASDHPVETVLSATVEPGGLQVRSAPVRMAAKETREVTVGTVTIDRPALWWPAGYGTQPLYRATVRATVGGIVSHEQGFDFGVRKFTYAKDGPLEIRCNGTRIVCRGGNWGMDDANLACTPLDYEVKVRLHAQANFNMIRNWVGMVNSEDFYAACDRYGVMVWDDFWLANPFDGPEPADVGMFLANAEDKVLKNRHHAALALYCGRNEGVPPPSLSEKLPALVARLDGTRHYIPDSAAGSVSGRGPYHLQTAEWYFENMPKTLHSERGLANIPEIETMCAMLTSEHAWPIDDVWGMHDFTLNLEYGVVSFMRHMRRAYREPRGLDDFVRLAQFVGYEGHKAMFESVYTSGSQGLLMWMSQSAWPSMVWQTYDYWHDVNGGYEGARVGCQPVNLILNRATREFTAVNETGRPLTDATARIDIFDLKGKPVWNEMRRLLLPAGARQKLCPFPALGPELSTVFVRGVIRSVRDERLGENFSWIGFGQKPDFRALVELPQDGARVTGFAVRDGEKGACGSFVIENPTELPLVLMRMRLVDDAGRRVLPVLWSENYVSLMPGESRQVSFEVPGRRLTDGAVAVAVGPSRKGVQR